MIKAKQMEWRVGYGGLGGYYGHIQVASINAVKRDQWHCGVWTGREYRSTYTKNEEEGKVWCQNMQDEFINSIAEATP